MLEWFEYLIANYGYLAIGLACFVEGETALFLGALAARQGILEFPGVMLAGLVGTVTGDNMWFYLGRYFGKPFIARRPRWRERADYARAQLDRYGALFIISLRFFYGLRSVTPFVMGAAKVSRVKFFLCDLLGTVVWLTVVGAVVLLLGAAVSDLMAAVRTPGGATAMMVAGVSLFAVIAALFYWRIRLDHKAKEKQPP